MTAPRMTAPQKRALLWLPADGAWAPAPPPRFISEGVYSLRIYHQYLCEAEWIKGYHFQYRLTPDGIALRAELEATKGRDDMTKPTRYAPPPRPRDPRSDEIARLRSALGLVLQELERKGYDGEDKTLAAVLDALKGPGA